MGYIIVITAFAAAYSEILKVLQDHRSRSGLESHRMSPRRYPVLSEHPPLSASGESSGPTRARDPRRRDRPIKLPGEVASPANPPSGCYFHPRCRYRMDRCETEEPALRQIAPDHFCSCHRAEELRLAGVSGSAQAVA